MSVALRIGLRRVPDVELGTVATLVSALLVVATWAAGASALRAPHAGAAWPFLLAGLLSPGAAQLFVTLGIRDAGASRSSVVLGTAPLVAVTIALIFLGEPLSAPLLAGAVLIVLGGTELVRERERPAHFRTIGLVFAFVAAVLFSIRDNVVRSLAGSTSVPPATASAAALLGGALLAALLVAPRLRGRPLAGAASFVPAGLCFGLSYVALFEAFYRGRITVVSPLVATESLWGVLLSLVFLRESEVVGRRLLLGAALIVCGGVLIGAFR